MSACHLVIQEWAGYFQLMPLNHHRSVYSSLLSCCWQHSTDGGHVLGYQTCDLMWLQWHFLTPIIIHLSAHNRSRPSALSPYWSPFGQGLFPHVLPLPFVSLSLISWSTTDPCSQDERSCNWRGTGLRRGGWQSNHRRCENERGRAEMKRQNVWESDWAAG